MFEVNEKAKDHIVVHMDSETSNIGMLSELVESFSGEYLSFEEAYNMAVATDEAITNIITHAYSSDSDKSIYITLYKKEDEICIQIEDFSKNFVPPLIVEKKKFSFDKLEEGGLGLYLMQEFMDELRFLYDNDQNKNILIMKKFLL